MWEDDLYFPSERDRVETWLEKYGVQIKDYTVEYVYDEVCEACSCPRGDKISVLVGQEDIGIMKNEVRWTRE